MAGSFFPGILRGEDPDNIIARGGAHFCGLLGGGYIFFGVKRLKGAGNGKFKGPVQFMLQQEQPQEGAIASSSIKSGCRSKGPIQATVPLLVPLHISFCSSSRTSPAVEAELVGQAGAQHPAADDNKLAVLLHVSSSPAKGPKAAWAAPGAGTGVFLRGGQVAQLPIRMASTSGRQVRPWHSPYRPGSSA